MIDLSTCIIFGLHFVWGLYPMVLMPGPFKIIPCLLVHIQLFSYALVIGLNSHFLPSGVRDQEQQGSCKAKLLNLYLLQIILAPGRQPNCKHKEGAQENHCHITCPVTFSKIHGFGKLVDYWKSK